MAKETKRSGLLLGTIIGGVIGVASALLFAPKKGTELREDLTNKYRTLSDKTEQFASAVGQRTQEITSTIGQKTQEIAKNVSSQIPELVDKAKQTKQNVMNSWQSVKEDSQRDKEDQQSSNKPN